MTGDWKKILNKELHDLYCLPNIIIVFKTRTMKWVGCVWHFGGQKSVLVVKSQRNKPLERPRRRWKDNVKTDMKETAWSFVDWIHLAQVKNR